MLRAVVGVCLSIALCSALAQPADGPQSPLKTRPSLACSAQVAHAPGLAIEIESEIQDKQPASEPLRSERPDTEVESPLPIRRKDRDGTHLRLLLTCGRLLI